MGPASGSSYFRWQGRPSKSGEIMPDNFENDPANVPPAPEPDYAESMPMYEKTMAMQQASIGVAGGVLHNPSVTELLRMKAANLERELELVRKAMKLAEEQSGAMALIDSIAKTRVHG